MPVQQSYGSIADLVGERKKASDTITSILNKETKPNYGDVGRSFSQTMMAINDPKLFKPQTTQEAFESRRQSAIAPYAAQVSVLDSDIQKGQDEAKSIISSFQQFADNPDDLALLFDAAQNDPEEVNSSNAATFAARKAKELGLQSAKKMQAQAQLNYSNAKLGNMTGAGSPQIIHGIPGKDGEMLLPPETGEGGDKTMWQTIVPTGKLKPQKGNKFISNGSEIREVPAGYDEKTGTTFGTGTLNTQQEKGLSTAKDALDTFGRLESLFKPEYAQVSGVPFAGGLALEVAKRYPRSDTDMEKLSWWQDYNKWANNFRHELFGSALTAGEQAAWNKANIDENTAPENVERFLAIQKDLFNKAMNRTVGKYATVASPEYLEQALGMPREDIALIMRENVKPKESTVPATNGIPKVGEVRKGYVFKGGDPADKNNWEKQ